MVAPAWLTGEKKRFETRDLTLSSRIVYANNTCVVMVILEEGNATTE